MGTHLTIDKNSMVRFVETLLDDEDGINDDAFNMLFDIIDGHPCFKHVLKDIKAQSGRWYLPWHLDVNETDE